MSTNLSDKVLFAQFLKLIKENEMVYIFQLQNL
jgi:hypothetical protein